MIVFPDKQVFRVNDILHNMYQVALIEIDTVRSGMHGQDLQIVLRIPSIILGLPWVAVAVNTVTERHVSFTYIRFLAYFASKHVNYIVCFAISPTSQRMPHPMDGDRIRIRHESTRLAFSSTSVPGLLLCSAPDHQAKKGEHLSGCKGCY